MQTHFHKHYRHEKGAGHKANELMTFLPIALCALLLASCSFEPPHAPRWDTELTIPLISKRFTMQEPADDEKNLSADSLGQLYFVSETKLDTFRVGEQLALNSLSESFVTSLGAFTVPAPGASGTQIALSQIYSGANTLNGQTVPVPPFTFAPLATSLPGYQNFAWVEIDSGGLTMMLRNDLAMPLGNQLNFELRDAGADTVIVAFNHFGEVEPGGEMIRTFNLAGKRFSNALRLVLSGSSPGSRGRPVKIDPNSTFTLSAHLSRLRVKSASAYVGPQFLSAEGEATISDSIMVRSARIKRGAWAINLEGQFPLPVVIRVQLPDFHSPAQAVITDSFWVAPGGSARFDLDLAGYQFQPGPPESGKQRIRFHWWLRTTNGPNDLVTLKSSDFMSASFNTERVVFSEVTGGFNEKIINIAPQSFELDLPEGLDSLQLADVNLELMLSNSINFPLRTDFLVEGMAKSGRVVALMVRERILPGQDNGDPVESRIMLNRSNSNIGAFLNALPRTITVRGRVIAGEPGHIASINENSKVSGTMRFEAPLAFTLPAQRAESKLDSLKIDESTRERLENNLHSGKVLARINNHLPAGASLSLHFALADSMVFKAPEVVIGPFHITEPLVDPASGRVVQVRQSEIEVALNEAQLKIFEKSPVYSGVALEFPGTNGNLVRVVASDFIEIRAVAAIMFTVDPEKLAE